MHNKVPLLVILLATNTSTGFAEGIRRVWNKEMISESALSEVGRTFADYDSLKYSPSTGAHEITSDCHWERPVKPPFEAGSNGLNSIVLQLGDRDLPSNFSPLDVGKMGSGGKAAFTRALLSQEEIAALASAKFRIQIHIQGEVDRCPSWSPPSLTPKSYAGLMRSTLMWKFYCVSGSDKANFLNTALWQDIHRSEWPAVESRPVNEINYIDLNKSECNGNLYVSVNISAQERAVIRSLEVTLHQLP